MAKDGWKETREGFDKWIKFTCKVAIAWICLNIVAVLPDALADKIVNKLLGMFGL